MAYRFSRKLILAAAAAPLALGLAGCKKDAATPGTEVAASAPLPNVPAPAGKAWSDVVATTPEGGWRMGNPDAPIKLIEYGSLSCPHCAKLAVESSEKLVNSHVASGRVSWEFRSFVIHGVDVPLTMLASCGSTEAFFPLIEQIYSNFDSIIAKAQAGQPQVEAAMQLAPDKRFSAMADAQGLTEFFAARGISTDQAHACLSDSAKATAIAKLAETYGAEGIESPPTLFINGAKLTSPAWPELDAALQRAGAR